MVKYLAVAALILASTVSASAQDQKQENGFEYGMEQWFSWHPESYGAYGPHTWGSWGGGGWGGNCPWGGRGGFDWKNGRRDSGRGWNSNARSGKPAAAPLSFPIRICPMMVGI